MIDLFLEPWKNVAINDRNAVAQPIIKRYTG